MHQRKKKIRLGNREIEYSVRRHRRAKYLRLTVNCDSSVALTVPRFVRLAEAQTFMREKAKWILGKIEQLKSRTVHWCCRGTREQYSTYKEIAREIITKKVEQYNRIYNFPYHRLVIKNQKTRWGSCSRNGILNFN